MVRVCNCLSSVGECVACKAQGSSVRWGVEALTWLSNTMWVVCHCSLSLCLRWSDVYFTCTFTLFVVVVALIDMCKVRLCAIVCSRNAICCGVKCCALVIFLSRFRDETHMREQLMWERSLLGARSLGDRARWLRISWLRLWNVTWLWTWMRECVRLLCYIYATMGGGWCWCVVYLHSRTLRARDLIDFDINIIYAYRVSGSAHGI